jgi:transcriptional regulator with XRE-family HTH domain
LQNETDKIKTRGKMMNILGTRVAELRKKRGLTQEQLADAVSVSRSVLSLVEAGIRPPSKEMAKKLSVYFRVPAEMFLFEDAQVSGSKNKSMTTAQIIRVFEIIKEYLEKNGYNITEEQKTVLVEYFCQQNLTDAEQIKQQLSIFQAMQSGLLRKE